jgi:hypothetical protein
MTTRSVTVGIPSGRNWPGRPGFRDMHPPKRPRPIGPGPQLHGKRVEEIARPGTLDLLDAHTINTGRSAVGTNLTPGSPHDVAAGDMVKESMETTIPILLGTAVQHTLKGTNPVPTRQGAADRPSRYIGTHQRLLPALCASMKYGPFPHRRFCCPTAQAVLRPAPTPARPRNPFPGFTAEYGVVDEFADQQLASVELVGTDHPDTSRRNHLSQASPSRFAGGLRTATTPEHWAGRSLGRRTAGPPAFATRAMGPRAAPRATCSILEGATNRRDWTRPLCLQARSPRRARRRAWNRSEAQRSRREIARFDSCAQSNDRSLSVRGTGPLAWIRPAVTVPGRSIDYRGDRAVDFAGFGEADRLSVTSM